MSNRPMDSSSHSMRCFKPAMVARASLEVVIVEVEGSPSPPLMPLIVLGATPHSSLYEGAEERLVCVLGVGRGVEGTEMLWKEGGGEVGVEAELDVEAGG